MKKRMILGTLGVFMLCSLCYGAKPTNDEADEQATSIVAELHAKANLTTKQQDKIREKTKEYTSKLKEARSMSNKQESFNLMKNSEDYYKMLLDSLLTPEQKQQVIQKEKAQKEEIIKLLNTKYKN